MKNSKRIIGSTFDLLRELEAHLAALQISVESGGRPVAAANLSRQILAEVLTSLGHSTDTGLPLIEDDDT